jgi:hypothetical protein
MTHTDEFVGALHVIAASDSPIDRQKEAVRDVLARFVLEAAGALGRDLELVRTWLEGVELELTRQALQPRADRFADLRDHATRRRLAAAEPASLTLSAEIALRIRAGLGVNALSHPPPGPSPVAAR